MKPLPLLVPLNMSFGLLLGCAQTTPPTDPVFDCGDQCDVGTGGDACETVARIARFDIEATEETPDHGSGQVIGGSTFGAIQSAEDEDWSLLVLWRTSPLIVRMKVDSMFPDFSGELCLAHLDDKFIPTSESVCQTGTTRFIDGLDACCASTRHDADGWQVAEAAISTPGEPGDGSVAILARGESCARYFLDVQN